MRSRLAEPLIVGVDTGGTFTDFVCVTAAGMIVRKIPSTPDNPAQAVLEGLAGIAAEDASLEVVHGSTVATNALLERKGASTLLITTAGFEDVIEIARQNRRDIYDLMTVRIRNQDPCRMILGHRRLAEWIDAENQVGPV